MSQVPLEGKRCAIFKGSAPFRVCKNSSGRKVFFIGPGLVKMPRLLTAVTAIDIHDSACDPSGPGPQKKNRCMCYVFGSAYAKGM